MDRLGDRPLIAGERADAADHCLAGISRLSSEVKDASTYLPPYDQRTYAEAIKALQDKLQETRASFAPKQKFSFRSARKSPSAISLSDAAELAAQKRRNVPGYLSPNGNTPNTSASATPGYLQTPPNERSTTNRPVPDSAAPPSSLHQAHSPGDDDPSSSTHDTVRPTLSTSSTSIAIASQSHTHILLPTTPHPYTPCTISRLTSCVLDLSSPTKSSTTTSTNAGFASLTINSTTTSLLQCAPVAGPAHVTNLTSSVLVLTCRQLRMHNCTNVDVYLHCTSRPIIEDCKGIRFSPLPKTYADLLGISSTTSTSTDAASSGSADTRPTASSTTATSEESEARKWGRNLFDQVDDFKWLKTEPSPNWRVMEDGEKVPEETWREVVPGGPGWRVDDILKAVGVKTAS